MITRFVELFDSEDFYHFFYFILSESVHPDKTLNI